MGLHLPLGRILPLTSCSLEQKPGCLNSAFDGHSISGVRGRRRNFLPTHTDLRRSPRLTVLSTIPCSYHLQSPEQMVRAA